MSKQPQINSESNIDENNNLDKKNSYPTPINKKNNPDFDDDKVIIAFDMDDTLVHFWLCMNGYGIVYTGFSVKKWRAFCQAIQLVYKAKGKNVIFAAVTSKVISRSYEGRGHDGVL